MKLRAANAILLMVLATSVAWGQERYVKPVDQARKDASFLAFRKKLITAAERKDVRYILSILDKNITSSFGGHEGVDGFREYWKIEKKDTKFWTQFLKAVRNGGYLHNEGGVHTFTAPYSFSGFPDDLDAFEYSVIFGERVSLRDAPGMNSKVVGSLSYNIVAITGSDPEPDGGWEDPKWYRIRSLGGKEGWVSSDYVRSPIDYRAGFEKKRGVWKMVFFVAGD